MLYIEALTRRNIQSKILVRANKLRNLQQNLKNDAHAPVAAVSLKLSRTDMWSDYSKGVFLITKGGSTTPVVNQYNEFSVTDIPTLRKVLGLVTAELNKFNTYTVDKQAKQDQDLLNLVNSCLPATTKKDRNIGVWVRRFIVLSSLVGTISMVAYPEETSQTIKDFQNSISEIFTQ